MGLAISLVATVPEKVWYHGCPSRGKSCNNSRLTTHGGCAIWYNEVQVGSLSDLIFTRVSLCFYVYPSISMLLHLPLPGLLCTTIMFQLLGEIEEHLGVTIQQVQPDVKVTADEFDGKVVYGAKRMNQGYFILNFLFLKRFFFSRWAFFFPLCWNAVHRSCRKY